MIKSSRALIKLYIMGGLRCIYTACSVVCATWVAEKISNNVKNVSETGRLHWHTEMQCHFPAIN